MAWCAQKCQRTDGSGWIDVRLASVVHPTYATFSRGPRPQGAARVQCWLLVVALAFPAVVGLLGISRLYAFSPMPSQALTVNRPLVGAQPVMYRPAAAVSDPHRGVAHDAGALTPATVVTATPVPPVQRTYTVQRGDELRHIAADHGVTMRSLLKINDVPDPDRLRVGQVLRLPDPQ